MSGGGKINVKNNNNIKLYKIVSENSKIGRKNKQEMREGKSKLNSS